MKRILLLVVLAGFLAACATDNTTKYNPKEFDTENYQKNVDNAVDAADILKDFNQSKLPSKPLVVSDLSNLVQADLFYNQSEYIKAYPLYKVLAFKYKDPRIIYKAIICLEHVSVTNSQLLELNELVNLFIEVDPSSKLAKLFQIKVALMSNNPALAKKDLASLIDNNKTDARAIFLFISSIISSDLTSSSQQALNNFASYAMSNYTDYPEASLMAVVAYASTNNLEQLQSTLEYIHLHYPNWSIPLYWSLDVLAHNNHVNEVIQVVRPILYSQTIPDPVLQDIYVGALINTNQLKEASSYLNRELKAGNGNKNNLFLNLGIIAEKSSNYPAAISYLEQSKTTKMPLKDIVNMNLATLLDYEGSIPEAIKYYQTVSNVNLVPLANFMLLNDYVDLGNYESANLILDKIAQKSGVGAKKLILFKSSYYIGIDKYQAAYDILKNQQGLYAKDKEYVYQYASAAAMLGKTDQAIMLYKKYIKMEPNKAYGYNDLAYLYADQTKEYKLAKTYADRAYKLAPTDPIILDTVGWVYFKLGNVNRALPYIKTSYEITQDPDSAKHLIQVYNALNQADMAKKVVVISRVNLRRNFKQLLALRMLKLLMYAKYGNGAR